MVDFLSELADKYMTSQAVLIERATEHVLAEMKIATVPDLKAAFDEVLVSIEVETYRLYLEDERRMTAQAVRDLFFKSLEGTGPYSRDQVAGAADGAAIELARLFMHLSQSRRSKAGRTFETNLRGLFRRLSYPFDEQIVINGKPDFLMPGKALFDVNPAECIIFTAKRTLRERWRQITTEGKHFRLFLATIDEGVSENQLKEMLKQQVYLVIPRKKIEASAVYGGAQNVLSFGEFFRDFLDPAVTRWKAKDWA